MTGELYFETCEVELFSERLGQARIEFIHRVQEQPWGRRVMRFYDPDGHIIVIGEPVEVVVRRLHDQGMSISSIVERPHLPKELVERAVRS